MKLRLLIEDMPILTKKDLEYVVVYTPPFKNLTELATKVIQYRSDPGQEVLMSTRAPVINLTMETFKLSMYPSSIKWFHALFDALEDGQMCTRLLVLDKAHDNVTAALDINRKFLDAGWREVYRAVPYGNRIDGLEIIMTK